MVSDTTQGHCKNIQEKEMRIQWFCQKKYRYIPKFSLVPFYLNVIIKSNSKMGKLINTYSNIFEYNIFDNIFGIQKKILLYHIPLMNDYNFLNF